MAVKKKTVYVPPVKPVGRAKRRIIPVAFNMEKHADILGFISQTRELKGISENKMIREILYHGKERIERKIKEKRYFINPEDKS